MTKLESPLPEGFDCSGCKKFQKFGAYVAAHWDISLTHTCPDCGQQHNIIRGIATPVATRKPSVKK
jgi:transcription elongation factor Elf1